MFISNRCLLPFEHAAGLLLQGCQLTQYTEGYTPTLLGFARKVLRVSGGLGTWITTACFPENTGLVDQTLETTLTFYSRSSSTHVCNTYPSPPSPTYPEPSPRPCQAYALACEETEGVDPRNRLRAGLFVEQYEVMYGDANPAIERLEVWVALVGGITRCAREPVPILFSRISRG